MPDTSQTPPAVDVDALVERWHADAFVGSRLARDTETWNLVHAATQDLKARLAAALALPQTQTPKG